MKRTLLFTLLLSGLLIGFSAGPLWEEVDRFDVPEGFIVEEVLSPDEAGSVVAMTFDSHGHLVLAREDSFIVTLLDPDGDGTFEQRAFSEDVFTSQGVFFDGEDLLVVSEGLHEGDTLTALFRAIDEDGDHRAERTELVAAVRGEISEHGPHNPYFGPDGYLYWSIGNFAALYEATSPLSPVRSYQDANLEVARTNGFAADTRAPGSIIVRKNLQEPGSDWEMVAAGMRNHYDGAFNLMGELFTYDSDMEWDRGLPWFRETRSIHLAPGGDWGWRSGNMKHPAYYIDDLPPMEDVGRGSPTGVTFYQGYNYPEAYHDVFLQSDWSRGRIIMGRLTKNGATYTQDSSENFVYGTPLNVTDLEVGPDGNVYFTLGGRDTDGGVYRVVYTGPDAMTQPEATTPIERVLTLIQPRAAFSRRQAFEVKQEMGEAAWQQELTAVARDAQADPERRVRAMELLEVFGPGLDENTLIPLGDDPSWEVRAAATYYLGMQSRSRRAQPALAERLHDADPFVQRRAAEALLRLGIHPGMDVSFSAVDDVMPLLASEDRFVRYAGRALLREINRNDWQEAALAADGFPQAPEALLAFVQSMDSPYIKDLDRIVERELELLRTNPSDEDLLPLLRTMQRTMLEDQGVVFGAGFFFFQQDEDAPAEGYAGIGEELLARFPTDDWRVNREIARILAYLESEGAAGAIATELHNPELDREQQIAYADALSFIENGWDDAAIDQMASWLEKVYSEEWRGGRQFMSYIDLIHDDYLDNLPDTSRTVIAERIEAAKPQKEPLGGFAGRLNLSPLSQEELEEELVYNPDNFEGEFDNGAWAYEKALCATCHTFGPIGNEIGPDLTTVNQRFNRADLVAAIMRPSETISDLWRMETITRTNGEVVSGTVFNETAQNVVVQVPAGPQVTIPKSEIQSRSVAEVSPMPEGLLNLLNGDEQRALLLFLEAGPSAIPDTALARINGQ